MEVEEAALCLCQMKRQELDTNTCIILGNLIQRTETRKSPETHPVPHKRILLPATCPIPRPQISRKENKMKIIKKVEKGKRNENKNKIENGNINWDQIKSSGNRNENTVVFEPNPDFIERLNQGVIIVNKLPPLGHSIDGVVLPRFPPIEALRGQISNCSAPFEKQLTVSDLRTDQARLNFCKDQVELVLKRFITEKEYNKVISKEGLEVIVYDRKGRTYEMKLKLWSKKMHVLSVGWNEFCIENKFELHLDWVTVWIFRHKEIEKLCFSIVERRFPTEDLIEKSRKNVKKNKKPKIEQ